MLEVLGRLGTHHKLSFMAITSEVFGEFAERQAAPAPHACSIPFAIGGCHRRVFLIRLAIVSTTFAWAFCPGLPDVASALWADYLAAYFHWRRPHRTTLAALVGFSVHGIIPASPAPKQDFLAHQSLLSSPFEKYRKKAKSSGPAPGRLRGGARSRAFADPDTALWQPASAPSYR